MGKELNNHMVMLATVDQEVKELQWIKEQNFSPETTMGLQVLLSAELTGMTYSKMKQFLIDKKNETTSNNSTNPRD